SWYVESLTEDLAQAAWAWFTEIERAGGLVAALSAGLVGERIAAAWSERAKRLATRADALTGVSEFPNPVEPLPTRRPAPAPPPGWPTPGRRWPASAAPTATTPTPPRSWPPSSARPGPRRCGWPGRRRWGWTGWTGTCTPDVTPSRCCAASWTTSASPTRARLA